MSDLTPAQLQVLDALLSGATLTAAAAKAGVHRNTVANWRASSLSFRNALATAEYERALLHREKAELLVNLAYQQLASLLADPKTPASIRFKAIQYIIDTASTPPAPKTETIPDFEFAAAPNTAAAAPKKPVDVHNPAQSPDTGPAAAPSVVTGYNDPCPCGSGQTFKRCCLTKPAQPDSAKAA